MVEGYDEEFIEQLHAESEAIKAQNIKLTSAIAGSSYGSQLDQNSIQFQLDPSDILNRIEHFLKGDFIKVDDDGNEFWEKQTNDDLILYNQYGVSLIMNIMGNYINHNTMLTFYSDEMRINEILGDIGDELVKLFYCSYEKMLNLKKEVKKKGEKEERIVNRGNEWKKARVPITILMLLHITENSYRRAIRGKTAENINTSRIFTGSEIIQKGGVNPLMMKKKFNLFRPGTW